MNNGLNEPSPTWIQKKKQMLTCHGVDHVRSHLTKLTWQCWRVQYPWRFISSLDAIVDACKLVEQLFCDVLFCDVCDRHWSSASVTVFSATKLYDEDFVTNFQTITDSMRENDTQVRQWQPGFTKLSVIGPIWLVTGQTGPDRFRFRPIPDRPKFKI